MRDKLIPEPARLRYKLDKNLYRVPPIENKKVGRNRIKRILEMDTNAVFKGKSTSLKGFMASNEFAHFGGNIRSFTSDIERRKDLRFFCLMYVGKSFNHLEAPYRNPDLSFLVTISRLNIFALIMEELTGKKTKVTVATENGLFDRCVLGTSTKKSGMMVLQAKKLARVFGFDRIEFKPLSIFLPKNFAHLVEEELDRLTAVPVSKENKEFREVFDTFLLSFPTKSFRQAVLIYSDMEKRKKIDQWALDTSLKYLAFTKARYNLGFWEGLADSYIRSSLSPKSGIVNFKYNAGRVTPPHGVAVVEKEKINTEHFYDLVKLHRDGGISLFKFDNMPFFFWSSSKGKTSIYNRSIL